MSEDWGNRREIKSSGGGTGFIPLDLSDYDVPLFKLAEGNNRIEILPYRTSSKLHPLIATGKIKKGGLDYNIVLYVHTNIGPGKKTVICPNKDYGKPCPICEAADAARKSGDKETNEALYAKRKVYMNVLNNAERDKGVQLFETNIKYFQKPLEVADANCEEDFPGKYFASVENGLTVKVLGSKETFNGHSFIKAEGISFAERKESVRSFVDKVVPLDQCIKLNTYEELENLMMGVDVPEDDGDAPRVKVSKPAVEDDDDAEEAPRAARKPKIEGEECPAGHDWGGAVTGDFIDCDKCDDALYAKCSKAGRALMK
jgi:hypothetical protein